jgi:hypothetical protein
MKYRSIEDLKLEFDLGMVVVEFGRWIWKSCEGEGRQKAEGTLAFVLSRFWTSAD